MSDASNSGHKVAIALVSTVASGTERRLGRLFRHLAEKHPDRYHLFLSREVSEWLRVGGFGLERLKTVHVLGKRSVFDLKQGAEGGWRSRFGRSLTLMAYRNEIKSTLRQHGIGILQVSNEMVPFLGMFPIRNIKLIASLTSHVPEYYDGRSLNSRLLVKGMRRADKVDTLYEYITKGALNFGIDPRKINSPRATCVDHDRFRPEPKEQLVTFVARAISWKNPQLMMGVIRRVLERAPGTQFHVLGDGPLLEGLLEEAQDPSIREAVAVGPHDRPYEIINRSLVHACLEEYDNAPNQSTLEGMAAGCALVATDVGLTRTVVTPDVGVLVPLDEAAIAERVALFVLNPESAKQLGSAGRTKAVREYNTKDYLEYLGQLHDFETPGTIVSGVREISRSQMAT